MHGRPPKPRVRMSATERSALAAPRRGPPGCFVYALLVEAREGPSAYVGHTVSLLGRMQGHRSGGAGKGSAALFSLSAQAGRPVRLAILETMDECGRHTTAYRARESIWYFRFADAGWFMANAEPDGGFRRQIDLRGSRVDLAPLVSGAEDIDDWLARNDPMARAGS